MTDLLNLQWAGEGYGKCRILIGDLIGKLVNLSNVIVYHTILFLKPVSTRVW